MDELQNFYAREGFVTVGLVWISMSLLGALPFVLSGDIPNYLDAVFETVSSFTTTGATILPQVEVLSRSCMFWRMFTQWGLLMLMFVGACAGSRVESGTLKAGYTYFLIYVLIIVAGTMVVSLDGYDMTTNFMAALACISNIGPGMGQIGPASCFNIFSAPVKMVLAVIMLLGRLELHPILAFFAPTTWRK